MPFSVFLAFFLLGAETRVRVYYEGAFSLSGGLYA
jgi:hypothetical protein